MADPVQKPTGVHIYTQNDAFDGKQLFVTLEPQGVGPAVQSPLFTGVLPDIDYTYTFPAGAAE